MQEEIWKDIPGYEEHYQVSDQGNVRSLDRVTCYGRSVKGRVLKSQVNNKGYGIISLRLNSKRKTYAIHKLVSTSFLNNNPDGTMKVVVDHINNIKTDNRLENLQLISQRENCTKDKKGSSKYTGVCWNKQKNKWRSEIRIKGKKKHLGYFKCELAAAAAYQKELIKLNK